MDELKDSEADLENEINRKILEKTREMKSARKKTESILQDLEIEV